MKHSRLDSPRNNAAFDSHSVAFVALVIVLAGSFLLGGSARGDVASLMVLRPLVVAALVGGLICLSTHDVKHHRLVLAFSAAVAALPLIHLIPLPPEIWTRLPGRELIVDIDRSAELGYLWRPLTLAPEATWNAFYAALVPLTVIVLGVHLREGQRQRLLPILLALGGCSVLLGLMQVAGPPDGPLYLYRVTNNGALVGLFANRNHLALLVAMMLPMLAVLAARFGRGTEWQRVLGLCLVIAGVALLPLLLLIGSRMGLVAGVAAIVALPVVIRTRGNRIDGSEAIVSASTRRRFRLIAGCALALVCATVVVLTVSWGQGFALDRLLSRAIGEDMRLRMLPTLWTMIARYWPIGSGVGSFEKVYKVHEPDELLGPEYVNHAHNDWLELLVATGAFGLVMLAIAAYALVSRGKRAWSTRAKDSFDGHLVRLGYVLIGLAALGSLGDYPLRVPSLAALFAVAVLWAGCPSVPREALTELEKS